jgi:hypothetical protein
VIEVVRARVLWYEERRARPNSELAARYGKRTGTAFADIVAGPNKAMRRVAHPDLIIWDADARGYRMDPADAEIVVFAKGRATCAKSQATA